MMESVIADGSAKKKFAEFIEAQGGDAAPVFDPSLLALAQTLVPVAAERSGYVHRILAEDIGIACMSLGGGRETKESAIDLSVGVILKKKNGDAVEAGDTLAVIYGNDEAKIARAKELILGAYEICDDPAEKHPVIRKYIFAE